MTPNATQTFTLTVATAQAPAITSATSTTFTTGTAGSFTVTASGVPTPTLSETGTLPTGVTFVDNGNGTATLSGTPARRPPAPPADITAANGVTPNATQSFTLTVNQATQGPTAPTNLTATGGAGQISLSWTASTDNLGVTGYLVYRESPGSSAFVQVGSAVSTSYTDTALAASSTYSYEVQATDAASNLSPFSNMATATTTATIPGLVAAYSFSEGTGTTVTDSSGNGNNGTIANATWTTSGKYSDALVFNGTNALVTIPDSTLLHLTTGMTLEAWVNPSTVNSNWRDVIYKGNDNYWLEGTSFFGGVPAAGATLGSSDVYTLGTAALTTNTWAFLTETYNGSTLALYVNGTQVSSLAQTGNILPSTNPLQIGGDSIYGQYFQGTIDEVRVYNVALTVAQIQGDMNTPIGNSTPTRSHQRRRAT